MMLALLNTSGIHVGNLDIGVTRGKLLDAYSAFVLGSVSFNRV